MDSARMCVIFGCLFLLFIFVDLYSIQDFLNRSMNWPLLDMFELRMGYCDLRSRLSELPLCVLRYEIEKYFVCREKEKPQK